MGVTVCPRREVLHVQSCYLPRFGTKVRDVDDHELPGDLRVEESEDEMGTAESCVNDLDSFRERQFPKLLHYSGAKPVVCEEGIPAACNHDLGIQH